MKNALLFALITLLTLNSCSRKKESPTNSPKEIEKGKINDAQSSCSNPEVIKTINEKVIVRLTSNMVLLKFGEKIKHTTYLSTQAGLRRTTVEGVVLQIRKEIENEVINGRKGNKSMFTNLIAETRESFIKKPFELVGARPSKKEEDIKKCHCEIDLRIKGESSTNGTFNYTVQIADNNRTIVNLLE